VTATARGIGYPRRAAVRRLLIVDLVRDLTTQNVQLAGQVGHWQPRAQRAKERLKLLEAPRDTPDSVVVVSCPWWARWSWWR
jgi:hypothetical protein